MQKKRQNEILSLIESKGFASSMELGTSLGVSESTVRRDLERLEKAGHIRRTRGGAEYVGASITTLDERSVKSLPQKQAIGLAAAALVEPGDSVLLDGGTTTLEVARNLVGKSLQVVTNSMPVANLLAKEPAIELVVIGGHVYPKTGVALGPMATAALADIHVRRLFMSVGGITQQGLYNSNSLLASTETAMLAAAEEVIVVADSGKFGHRALTHLCSLDRVDRVVVDSGIAKEWVDLLSNARIALTVAEV